MNLHDLERINQQDPEHIQIHGLWQEEPALKCIGKLPCPAGLNARYEHHLSQLHHNEAVCILAGLPDAPLAPPATLEFYESDYATALTLREAGQRPMLLAATTLLLNPFTASFEFQLRSARNHLYAGYLSLFGGGVHPTLDGAQCSQAALREVQEESGFSALLPQDTHWLLTREEDNGAVQITALNSLTLSDKPESASDDEGERISIAYDQLQSALDEQRYSWTPLAHCVIDAWACLGKLGITVVPSR
ncbi:NUDIX hydrolase [Pokkaliibacter sp. CJK22405]|uniref:NUDIX hydrolase n=1 Tax=Pokkaliibacter sp. CJK22405 TaxID=3384615 RepID=UPI0039852E1E